MATLQPELRTHPLLRTPLLQPSPAGRPPSARTCSWRAATIWMISSDMRVGWGRLQCTQSIVDCVHPHYIGFTATLRASGGAYSASRTMALLRTGSACTVPGALCFLTFSSFLRAFCCSSRLRACAFATGLGVWWCLRMGQTSARRPLPRRCSRSHTHRTMRLTSGMCLKRLTSCSS